jgi:hypothetical protein
VAVTRAVWVASAAEKGGARLVAFRLYRSPTIGCCQSPQLVWSSRYFSRCQLLETVCVGAVLGATCITEW